VRGKNASRATPRKKRSTALTHRKKREVPELQRGNVFGLGSPHKKRGRAVAFDQILYLLEKTEKGTMKIANARGSEEEWGVKGREGNMGPGLSSNEGAQARGEGRKCILTRSNPCLQLGKKKKRGKKRG